MEGQIEMGTNKLKISKLTSNFADYELIDDHLAVKIYSKDILTLTMDIEEWRQLADEIPMAIRILAEAKW